MSQRRRHPPPPPPPPPRQRELNGEALVPPAAARANEYQESKASDTIVAADGLASARSKTTPSPPPSPLPTPPPRAQVAGRSSSGDATDHEHTSSNSSSKSNRKSVNSKTSSDSKSSNESSSSSSSGDDDDDGAEAMARLTLVSRRRTQRQLARRGINERAKAVLQSEDADLITFRFFAEIADAVLSRVHVLLADSPTWQTITGNKGYVPGLLTSTGTSEEQTSWMDLFVQLSCGWPSASIAFGPVTLPASHPLAKLAAESNEDTSSQSCIGTLSIKSSGDTLPPSELTSAILRLRQEAARFVAAPNRPNPMHVLRFVSSVSSALNDIERVLVGDGGTPKRPTEFQMQFMQRLNLAALQALSAFAEALAALTL